MGNGLHCLNTSGGTLWLEGVFMPPSSLNPNPGAFGQARAQHVYIHHCCLLRGHFGDRRLGCHLRPALPLWLFPASGHTFLGIELAKVQVSGGMTSHPS